MKSFFFHLNALYLVVLLFSCQKVNQKLDNSTEQVSDLTFSDSVSYFQKRQELIKKDKERHFGYDIQLNEKEKLADKKLQDLRQKQIEEYKKDHFFPPARYFYKSQKETEATQLFKYFKKMPKGGLLHTHSAALGNFSWIVEQATTLPNSYVYWADDNEKFVKGQLGFFKPETAPKGFILGEILAKNNPNFKIELLDLLTLDQQSNADRYPIWLEFEKIFQRITGFVTYQPIFKDFFRNALDSLLADGIQHLEVRDLLYFGLYDLEHESGYFSSDTMVQYYRDLEKEVQENNPEFTLKLIYTGLRFLPNKLVKNYLEDAFRIRQLNPDVVKGFDLVAEEDAGHTTAYFLPNWLALDSLSKKYQIDMPMYFHGGESDWVFENNLYDLILLNTKRIGHGFNLFRFPNLQKIVKEKDICVEINPLSNQILGYVRDLRIHPATYYLVQNIPMIISSDDPGVFGYVGVSPDYWAIWMAWDLDLKSLKKLVFNSIVYSALSEKEKNKSLDILEQNWHTFINFVLE